LAELNDWLQSQHPGLRTYKAFQQKTLALASSDTKHRALYCLLAELASSYVANFDEEPLPVDFARAALDRLVEVVARAEASLDAPGPEQLAALNRLAGARLF
jgi:hypothetical protein